MSESGPVVPGQNCGEEPTDTGAPTATLSTDRSELQRGLGAGVLTIAGLSSLAFAQPLFDLLRRSPEFFAIRDLSMVHVLALVALLAIGPTLVFSVPPVAARLFFPAWSRHAVAAAIGVLTVVIALQAGRSLNTGAATTIAAAAGTAVVWTYLRFRGVRSFAVLLSPAAVVVPALFLLDGDVRRSAGSRDAAVDIDRPDTGARAPIVMVIFDEWSLASILDSEGAIDRKRLPNLARLADRATWFPNATAAADASELAVPAMLTGSKPERGRLPTLTEHPANLFTLLAPSHDIYASEPLTSLCPLDVNLLGEPTTTFSERFGLLVSDLAVVWLQLTLPERWADRLPPVTQNWSGFGRDTAPTAPLPRADQLRKRMIANLWDGVRAAEFRRFITSIGPAGERPDLYFMHSLLPHLPWEYLPSGQRYHTPRGHVHGLREELWTTDPWVIRHHEKRYLLQVQFVDRLIGELTAHLESLGLFEQSLIVIAADHGVAFRPGMSRRRVEVDDPSGRQPLDLAAVPLVIKAPFQRQAQIDENPISLVDLTPRILELAGADPEATPPRANTKHGSALVGWYAGREVEIPVDRGPWLRERLAEQAALLGESNDPMTIGTVPSLHGRQVSEVPLRNSEVGIRLERADLWDHVDVDGAALPVIVEGTFTGPETLLERFVAVALNGIVAASVRPHRRADGKIRLAAMMPEGLLRSGLNQIDVFVIAERDDAVELEYVNRPPTFAYELSWSAQGQVDALLRRSKSAVDADVRVPVERRQDSQLIGYLEGGHRRNATNATVQGWAADFTDPGSALEVVAFLNGSQFWAGSTKSERKSVAERYGPEHLYSGFFGKARPGSERAASEVLRTVRREGFVAYAVSRRGLASRLRFFYAPLEFDQDGVEILPISDGRRLPVVQTGHGLEGAIDLITKPGRRTLIEGWAADIQLGERSRQIVVYRDSKFLKSLGANRERRDVVAHHDDPGLLRTGFRGSVPGAPEPETFAERHRVFALMLSGAAVELPIRHPTPASETR